MRIDEMESRRRTDAKLPVQKHGDCRTVPLDELKRQLGLNLIEAARDQSVSDTTSSLRNRR